MKRILTALACALGLLALTTSCNKTPVSDPEPETYVITAYPVAAGVVDTGHPAEFLVHDAGTYAFIVVDVATYSYVADNGTFNKGYVDPTSLRYYNHIFNMGGTVYCYRRIAGE